MKTFLKLIDNLILIVGLTDLIIQNKVKWYNFVNKEIKDFETNPRHVSNQSLRILQRITPDVNRCLCKSLRSVTEHDQIRKLARSTSQSACRCSDSTIYISQLKLARHCPQWTSTCGKSYCVFFSFFYPLLRNNMAEIDGRTGKIPDDDLTLYRQAFDEVSTRTMYSVVLFSHGVPQFTLYDQRVVTFSSTPIKVASLKIKKQRLCWITQS